MQQRTPNLKAEFVLDLNGRPPSDRTNLKEYLDCFSVEDVCQGQNGDCFFIATIFGLIKNRDLLAHLIPIDNALEANILKGAYHFRLWKLGEWYDVVIDDMLPLKLSYDLLFSRNMNHKNEFWLALFEKVITK